MPSLAKFLKDMKGLTLEKSHNWKKLDFMTVNLFLPVKVRGKNYTGFLQCL